MGFPVENGSREAPPVVDVRKINRYRLHRTRIIFRIIALISVFLGLCMDVAVVANALGTDWRLVHLGLSIVSECLSLPCLMIKSRIDVITTDSKRNTLESR